MKRTLLLVVFVLALLNLNPNGLADPLGLAHAQTGDGYDLTWNTIDGGGYMVSTGGSYSLGGTIGQPDAGVMNNGGYSLTGGFWGGAAAPYQIYLPVVIKG